MQLSDWLRRRNTIQKLSTCRATLFRRNIVLLQVEEMQRSYWLNCQSASKVVAHRVVCLMENEQQSQNLFHNVDLRSTFRNNVLQPATNVFVAQQVDYAR